MFYRNYWRKKGSNNIRENKYIFFVYCFQLKMHFIIFLTTAIKVGETRPITVDTQSAGKPDAPCKITATNPKGKPVDLPMKKTPAGFETMFAPLEPGPHLVKVEFAGQEVPKSPFEVPVEPTRTELKGVEVKGLETRKFQFEDST